MGCRIAENKPLQNLRFKLGVAPECHSTRQRCAQGLSAPEVEPALLANSMVGLPVVKSNAPMGAAGAVLGYCAALFNKVGGSQEHASQVINALSRIGAPWSRSIELFEGYRNGETVDEFVSGAAVAIGSEGRIPILITGYDPILHVDKIREIFDAKPVVRQTMLVRIVPQSEASLDVVASLVKGLYTRAQEKGEMPAVWPLFQATTLELRAWEALRAKLGDLWSTINIAVNPFTPRELIEALADQITVAQVAVGEKIDADGTVHLNRIKITGAPVGGTYNLEQYVAGQLLVLPEIPTFILLGPSPTDLPNAANEERVAVVIPHLKTSCKALWSAKGVDGKTAEEVLSMQA